MHECRRVLVDLLDAVADEDVHGGPDALRDLEREVLRLVPGAELVLEGGGLLSQRGEVGVELGERR